MIQRINLLEKERFKVTYGLLLTLFLSVLTICLFMVGSAWFGNLQATKYIEFLNVDINRLKIEREKLLSKGEVSKETGPVKEVLAILEREPNWAMLLSKIAKSLPSNVWLVSFKSFDKKEGEGVNQKSVILNGLAKKAKDLASFIKMLEEDPSFENIVLTSSKKEDSLFNFSVTCDIMIPRMTP